MARPSSLQVARNDIVKFFEEESQHVFRGEDLAQILEANREFWRARSVTTKRFIEFLLERTQLRQLSINPVHHQTPPATRFVWGDGSVYEIALSLKRDSYLTHGTAVFLHQLSDQIPHRLYVNKEQSPKGPPGHLTQIGIQRAFAGKQRESRYVFRFLQSEMVLLSGKNSNNLEVISINYSGASLRVTSLERTLIDIAVRPTYAGGPFQVLDAYKGAKGKVSTGRLIATLKGLNYAYPYHQTIGFYMQHAGFPHAQYERLKAIGLNYDFYAAYGIKNPEYVREWRLFVPKGFH